MCSCRFEELPSSLASQRYEPNVAYPGWDTNWDYCDLPLREVAKRLGHSWPITDYAAAVRKLYLEHTDKPTAKVDELIAANRDALPQLYKKAFAQVAYGGGVTRHIILVRHGQYEEQRSLARRLHAENPHKFGLPGDTNYAELDRARVLTEVGRSQALKAGDRLAATLAPALTTPGREASVRLHVSTLTRAQETAQLIASRLPPHVRQLPPDPNLQEGDPPAHIIPYAARGGEEFLQKRSRDVHIEGARMEAAFRSYFYRDLPCRPPKSSRSRGAADKVAGVPLAGGEGGGEYAGSAGTTGYGHSAEGAERASRKPPAEVKRHEWDILVCHGNVIRYFVLRALQLPPEAWLRLGCFNGSITHLTIRPGGSVSLRGSVSKEKVLRGLGHHLLHTRAMAGIKNIAWTPGETAQGTWA